MLPVLFRVPSKALWVLLLLLSAGLLIWTHKNRRSHSKSGLLLSLFPLLGAWYVLRWGSGSWLPNGTDWKQPWAAFPVHAYGTMLSLAMLGGWFLVLRLAKAEGISSRNALAIYMWSALWALFGARFLYFLTALRLFTSPLDALSLSASGMVAYGGMIGGAMASWYVCRKRHVPFLMWADAAIPAVALGTALTRIGCFLNGCDYGRRTDLAWGVHYPKESFVWIDQVFLEQLPEGALHAHPVHPVQLYESVACFILFAALIYLRPKRPFPGFLFLTWVMTYGLARTVIEIFRGDSDRGSIGPFSTSQWIGLLSAGLAWWGLHALRHRSLKESNAIRK